MHIRISLLLLLAPALAHAQLNVFTCEPEWAALVTELGGEHVSVNSATTAYQDPHHIQARPSLIAKTRRADLLICTGAELEAGWLPVLLRKSGNAAIQPGAPGYLEAADYVTMLEVPAVVDRSHGDVHARGNPHIHLDPRNLLSIAQAVKNRLQKLDSTNSQQYQSAYESFVQRWRDAIDRWSELAKPLAGLAVVAHHNYWPYLQHWAGFTLLATLEPLPGVQPSSSYLSRLLGEQGDRIALIIRVNYVNERATDWLSEKTGAPVAVLQSTVDFQNGESLQQWFGKLVQTLVAASRRSS